MAVKQQSVQLAFDLPHRAALGKDDFFVSGSNLAAVQMIDSWPHWPGGICLLAGPEGSGKTHLAQVWRGRSAAACVRAGETWQGKTGSSASVLVEDADTRIFDDTALFHMLNAVRENGATLLITARTMPAQWPYSLPDLVSRLTALPSVTIGEPDEELVAALLVKHFADRQIEVEPSVLLYIVRRIGRSMATVSDAVDALDRRALGAGRRVTRRMATEILSASHPEEA